MARRGGETVVIVGSGQMALVLSDALVERGHEVVLWSPFAEQARTLAETRRSPDHLPDFDLPAAVMVTADDDATARATLLLNAMPTQFIRVAWKRVGAHAPAGVPIACVSKGIEQDTLLRPSAVLHDVLGADDASRPVCALSGPTIAAELARRLPATMVAAATDAAVAERVQTTFSAPWLRIYRHDDPLGVELAGATKNVIALAAGLVDGLGAGDNAKSAILARGLAEIVRLGVAMGASAETFFGVAGVGDLATTCFSPSGRNRTCGERLGRGEPLDAILASRATVVEGVPTTRALLVLAERHGVDMPITQAVGAILFGGLDPREAIDQLMSRSATVERIG